jgi:hypothetical protein
MRGGYRVMRLEGCPARITHCALPITEKLVIPGRGLDVNI